MFLGILKFCILFRDICLMNLYYMYLRMYNYDLLY